MNNRAAPLLLSLFGVGLVLALCLGTPNGPAVVAPAAKPCEFPPTTGDVLILCADAVDGDTVDFYFLVPERGRLYGIDAPEARGKTKAAGLASREFLQALLPKVPTAARLHGRDKYGRVLLTPFTPQGVDLVQELIKAGHGKPWDGKGPKP